MMMKFIMPHLYCLSMKHVPRSLVHMPKGGTLRLGIAEHLYVVCITISSMYYCEAILQ